MCTYTQDVIFNIVVYKVIPNQLPVSRTDQAEIVTWVAGKIFY